MAGHVYVCVQMSVYICGSELHVSCFPSEPFVLLFETGSQRTWRVHSQMAWLARELQRPVCLSPLAPALGSHSHILPGLAFVCVLGT